jgi:hypothetical protein
VKRRIAAVVAAIAIALGVAGCESDADVASRNLSTAADNFEVARRIVFYNGITGDYILEITGFCSVGNNDAPPRVSITCKTGPSEFKKHYLDKSDNVTWFAEQINPAMVSKDHYRVVFKPSTIIPDIDAR